MTEADQVLRADLVLEGGGVKGIGLVGAAVALTEAGYTLNRVSGTSAGAVVGSIVAAGLTGQALKEVALSMDYRKFLDPTPLGRIPFAGPGLELLLGNGVFKGDYAHDWVRSQLADLNIHTFGDLKIKDEDLPPERRYKLVVTVSDVTLGQLVRLPWDYRSVYGLDPDEQSVADAVRASMSIPFFFRSVPLENTTTKVTSTLLDGGLLSNFPIDSLDRTDGKPPRWPTFGVTLLPNLPAGDDKVIPLLRLPQPGALHLLEQMISTILVGRDQTYLNQPWVAARAIRVDSTEVGVVDFEITPAETRALYTNGYQAALTFLSTWNWQDYLKRFR
ncbi:patatin-like phospholipase family protein [Nocardia sp. NPDC101769]|uniref:patatin-like phospholipase family protein n=1 Tax=Nocardia sp. NPDC101769 TaxID=3364333 RepID=UPI003808A1AE